MARLGWHRQIQRLHQFAVALISSPAHGFALFSLSRSFPFSTPAHCSPVLALRTLLSLLATPTLLSISRPSVMIYPLLAGAIQTLWRQVFWLVPYDTPSQLPSANTPNVNTPPTQPVAICIYTPQTYPTICGRIRVELTAASTVSDFHRIPFWFLPLREETAECKYSRKNDRKQEKSVRRGKKIYYCGLSVKKAWIYK